MEVFISYRRDDTRSYVARLVDTFQWTFPHHIFVDWGIDGGADFMNVISQQIDRSDVVLAVIGRNWAGKPLTGSGRGIDDPQDFVRREIERALAADKAVVPVLVSGATMPRESDLPESLRALTQINAVELRDLDWNDDAETLVRVLLSLKWAPKGDVSPVDAGSDLVALPHHLNGDRWDSRIRAWPASGTYLSGDYRGLVVAGSNTHKLHLVAATDEHVLRGLRLRRRPHWTPTSVAFALGCTWIADPANRSIWRVEKTRISHTGFDGSTVGPRRGLRLRTVRRRRMEGQPFSVVAEEHLSRRVWVLVCAESSRHGSAGALLGMSRDFEIDAHMSLPEPRQLAIGLGAVWVAAAEGLVARFDLNLDLPSGITMLNFHPRCITVGDEDVWVGGNVGTEPYSPTRGQGWNRSWFERGSQFVAQVDGPTGHLLGSFELPASDPVTSLVFMSGDLWVATPTTVYRVDPRRHNVIESLALPYNASWQGGHLPHAQLVVGEESELYIVLTFQSGSSRVMLLRLRDQIKDMNSEATP